MRQRARRCISGCRVATLLLAGASVASHAEDAPDGSVQAVQLQTVVVTAQKRETLLLRTPEAVTALDGDALKDRGATMLADLPATVPNLSFTSNFGIAQIFIRGIGNNFFSPGGDPGVAFYADGTYVSDQETTNISLFDARRVEVLRGPQGALYGRNATGGALNVLSALPTADFRAQVSVLAGDYGRLESEGFVSGPVGDGGTTGRLSFQVKRLDGFTPNELAGAPGAPSRLDDQDSKALRLQTSTGFSAGARLRLIATAYDEKDNGPASKILPEAYPLPAELLYGARPSDDPRSMKSQLASNRRRIYSVVTDYTQPVGDNDLTVVAGYRTNSRQSAWDQDNTEADQATTKVDTHSHDFSIDARLASPEEGRLRWLVGATYLNFVDTRVTEIAFNEPLGMLVPGAPMNVPVPIDLLTGGTVRTTSYAVYGDMRYALTPGLSLNAGLRATTDRKSADELLQVGPLGPLQTASPSASWSNVPGKLGLEARIDADAMAYASVARGFKSGAINLGALQPPVEPETVTSVEIGWKSAFAQRRGYVAMAAFASNYRDMQVLQIGTVSQVLVNAPKTKINGLELETAFSPTRELQLSANIGVLDGKFTEFVTPDIRHGNVAVDVAGNRLPNVARLQATLAAELVHGIADGYVGSVRGEYAWRDRVYWTEFNTADAKQDAYGVVNLSASLRPSAGRWSLYGYVRNLTDVHATTSMSIVSPLFGSLRMVNLLPPRHFGIGARFDFQ